MTAPAQNDANFAGAAEARRRAAMLPRAACRCAAAAVTIRRRLALVRRGPIFARREAA